MKGFLEQKTELTRGMGTPAAPQARVTATGPNGQKLELVNGQWQPVK